MFYRWFYTLLRLLLRPKSCEVLSTFEWVVWKFIIVHVHFPLYISVIFFNECQNPCYFYAMFNVFRGLCVVFYFLAKRVSHVTFTLTSIAGVRIPGQAKAWALTRRPSPTRPHLHLRFRRKSLISKNEPEVRFEGWHFFWAAPSERRWLWRRWRSEHSALRWKVRYILNKFLRFCLTYQWVPYSRTCSCLNRCPNITWRVFKASQTSSLFPMKTRNYQISYVIYIILANEQQNKLETGFCFKIKLSCSLILCRGDRGALSMLQYLISETMRCVMIMKLSWRPTSVFCILSQSPPSYTAIQYYQIAIKQLKLRLITQLAIFLASYLLSRFKTTLKYVICSKRSAFA